VLTTGGRSPPVAWRDGQRTRETGAGPDRRRRVPRTRLSPYLLTRQARATEQGGRTQFEEASSVHRGDSSLLLRWWARPCCAPQENQPPTESNAAANCPTYTDNLRSRSSTPVLHNTQSGELPGESADCSCSNRAQEAQSGAQYMLKQHNKDTAHRPPR